MEEFGRIFASCLVIIPAWRGAVSCGRACRWRCFAVVRSAGALWGARGVDLGGGGVRRGRSAGLVGVVPAVFQALEEFGFDLWDDVAVDLSESVGQVVSEASGLGDLGNVVGDQLCLVAVPQAVEREARADRMGSLSEVAIDGGAEHAAVEGAAS